MDEHRRRSAIWGMLEVMLGNSEIRLEYDALRAAAGGAEAALDELEQLCRCSEAEVDRLLDGGWRGPAAGAFGEAWRDWAAGAASVRDALGSLAAAIRASEGVVRAADDDATAVSGSLLGRVGRVGR